MMIVEPNTEKANTDFAYLVDEMGEHAARDFYQIHAAAIAITEMMHENGGTVATSAPILAGMFYMEDGVAEGMLLKLEEWNCMHGGSISPRDFYYLCETIQL